MKQLVRSSSLLLRLKHNHLLRSNSFVLSGSNVFVIVLVIVLSLIILSGCAGPWITSEWYEKSADQLKSEGLACGEDVGYRVYFEQGVEELKVKRIAMAKLTLQLNRQESIAEQQEFISELQQFAQPANLAKLEILRNNCRSDDVCWSHLAHFGSGVTQGLYKVETEVGGGL